MQKNTDGFISRMSEIFTALGVSVWCFCLCVFWCFSVSVALLSVYGWAPLFLSCFLAVVGSPPCLMLLPLPLLFFSSSLADVALMARSLLPLPLQLVPCGALAQFLRWYLPLGSGCSCDGLVALLYCWECGCALSSLLHFASWQQRLLVFFPSDAFVASARSFNMFKSMLQLGLID